MKNSLPIPQDFLKKIFQQAEQEYPNECCGMIFGPTGTKKGYSKLRSCRNVQDQYHEIDPVSFPRNAKTAYFIEPKELLAIQKELRRDNEKIEIIYHSHIEAGAYFSEEDKRIASFEDEPVYPGVDYLVVSVIKGKVQEANLFVWDPAKHDFVSPS